MSDETIVFISGWVMIVGIIMIISSGLLEVFWSTKNMKTWNDLEVNAKKTNWVLTLLILGIFLTLSPMAFHDDAKARLDQQNQPTIETPAPDNVGSGVFLTCG